MMPSVKLEERIRAEIRKKGMAFRTEKSSVGRHKSLVRFHGTRHPGSMGKGETEAFLDDL